MERQKMKNSISPLKVVSLHQSMFIVFNENIFSSIEVLTLITYTKIYNFVDFTFLFLILIQCSISYFVKMFGHP